MERYRGLTDTELIGMLQRYGIQHGPVVGSTRKLYEKKIYEYESQRTKLHPPGGALSYADPSTTQSCSRESYSFPRQGGRHRYGDEDVDSESYEESSSSSSSSWLYGAAPGPLREATARQPISEVTAYARHRLEEAKRDSISYQRVCQDRPIPPPLRVEPRRAIHPLPRGGPGGTVGDGSQRFLPLWLQLLLFGLLAAFLAYVYCILQGTSDDNPFGRHLEG
ncbi:emerin-like isoform X2 [Carettochelys insculpta]|uniref:emerin-like isoform X2 n=1 Tax=Carettochelys insculpta TaxID=44489 RepID=UPI003EB71303